MKYRLVALMVLSALAAGLTVMPVRAQGSVPGTWSNPWLENTTPVVHGILFWKETCPHCHEVRERVLPPLEARYGDRLDIQAVELVSAADLDTFYALAEAYGIPREQAGIPLLIVGQDALMGSDQIEQNLPALIERYLAEGGAALPAVATAHGIHLSGGLENCNVNAPESCEESSTPGSQLGTFIIKGGGGLAALVFLLLLGVSGLSLRRVVRVGWPRQLPRWEFMLLILAGLGVAGYLTYVETRLVPAVCGPVGDCNAVQSSPYARLFGIVPVALLGWVGYLALAVLWLAARWMRPPLQRAIPLLLWGMAFFGVAFSIYLTALELFVLRAVCLWCLTSAVLMAGCLLLCSGLELRWKPGAGNGKLEA